MKFLSKCQATPQNNSRINLLEQSANQKAILDKTQDFVEWFFWKSDGLCQLINGSEKS